MDCLPFSDQTDFDNATRVQIATLDVDQITAPVCSPIYSFAQFDILKGDAPDTANPSLWRQSKLYAIHGLFEVVEDGIYQIRGFDLAVVSFIRGESGWIAIDPLTAQESLGQVYTQTICRFCDEVDVSFGSQQWPTRGNEEINVFWKGQRDTYRYIHDEVLRLANQGETMLEIAEELKLPDGLAKQFSNRSYYGTVNHNAKAQYQLYFGWFSGNPSELNELPPVEEGKKFVEYVDGADAIFAKAQVNFDTENYRWVSTALKIWCLLKPIIRQPVNCWRSRLHNKVTSRKVAFGATSSLPARKSCVTA